MIQFSLVSMLEMSDEGVLPIERIPYLMSHNPAQLFHIIKRGFIRPGYKADLVIVRPDTPWTLTQDMILSKCGWSPLEGHTFSWRVEKTLCNGHLIYNNGVVNSNYVGQPIQFR
jgi:dihydroorotase